jgi:hypothetical protein
VPAARYDLDIDGGAAMNPIRRIDITPDQARGFQDAGVLKLERLLTDEAITGVREMVEREIRGAQGGPGDKDDFKRARYDVGNRSDVTRTLLESPEFRRILHALIPGRVLFTQGIGFELTPGNAGLDWHFDLLSFSFIHPLDRAYTLWIPFERIDPTGQRGGLEYVPESAYSARDLTVLTYRHVQRGPRVIEELGGRDVYRAQMPCSPRDRVILEQEKIEPAFEPGDALLTTRYVWHRSCPLAPGPIPRRLAYILRFVDAGARYAGGFCRKLGEFSPAYGNANFKTEFGLSFTDLRDGDPMIASRFALNVV